MQLWRCTKVLVSNTGCVLALAFHLCLHAFFDVDMLMWVVGPHCVMNAWLIVVTKLQHTHPDVKHHRTLLSGFRACFVGSNSMPSHTVAHRLTPSHTAAHRLTPSHTMAHRLTPSHTAAHRLSDNFTPTPPTGPDKQMNSRMPGVSALQRSEAARRASLASPWLRHRKRAQRVRERKRAQAHRLNELMQRMHTLR